MSDTTTRAIIMAAGDDHRWTGKMGYPKHFLELEGEAILPRLVRQLRPQVEIVVSGHPDPRYKFPDASLFVPYRNRLNYDADNALSTLPLWNREGRTLILYGDVWYSDEAIATILGFEPREWQLFARFGPSEITGKAWGEPWAWSFYPEHIDEHVAAHRRTIRLLEHGLLWRCGAWEHYRAMVGLPDEQMGIEHHGDYGRATSIDDWTEDFDFIGDAEEWLARRAAADPGAPTCALLIGLDSRACGMLEADPIHGPACECADAGTGDRHCAIPYAHHTFAG